MSFPITTKRGDTWQGAIFNVSLNDIPLDLTNASILMQVKKTANDEDSVLEFSTVDETITITEPLSGSFEIPPVIITVVPRAYVYDVQITLNTGRIITPVSDSFTITSDVTR